MNDSEITGFDKVARCDKYALTNFYTNIMEDPGDVENIVNNLSTKYADIITALFGACEASGENTTIIDTAYNTAKELIKDAFADKQVNIIELETEYIAFVSLLTQLVTDTKDPHYAEYIEYVTELTQMALAYARLIDLPLMLGNDNHGSIIVKSVLNVNFAERDVQGNITGINFTKMTPYLNSVKNYFKSILTK